MEHYIQFKGMWELAILLYNIMWGGNSPEIGIFSVIICVWPL